MKKLKVLRSKKINFYSKFEFKVIHESSKSKARVCEIKTPHGTIQTPSFVSVGTTGTLKAIDNVFIEEHLDVDLMFVNTFHMLIHPGTDIVHKAGGIHNFINRKKPIITDSGGFQVFSLAYSNAELQEEIELKGRSKRVDMSQKLVKRIDEDGVIFKSYRNGEEIVLTPETSIDAQKKIGADIIIPFDELPKNSLELRKLKYSLDRTHRWEKRSLDHHLLNPNNQAIYNVIHGGTNLELRKQSIEHLCALPFDGIGIGGSLGKDREELYSLLQYIYSIIPKDKPNHLLGIGDIDSIEKGILLGVDTFDSAYPTRSGRHGNLFHSSGNVIKITNLQYVDQFSPIDEKCNCYTCKNYSVAYLHHLYKMNEPTFGTLGSIHNIQFINNMMKEKRRKILNDEI